MDHEAEDQTYDIQFQRSGSAGRASSPRLDGRQSISREEQEAREYNDTLSRLEGRGEEDYDRSDSRPYSLRSSTNPSPAMMLQDYFADASARQQPKASRNRSPYSRSHLRSRSSGSALAPVMIRAHSMPAVHSLRAYDLSGAATPPSGSLSPNLTASHSPQRSPARVRSPFKTDDSGYFQLPRSPHWFETSSGGPIESIQEDSELDLTPRNSAAFVSASPAQPPAILSSRTGSMRRRPASPLYSVAAASPRLAPTSSPADANQESPALAPAKLPETSQTTFQLHHYASTSSFSSISSTPSSVRSRSPSISSLETIEDAPDAEFEAIEADRLWRLQLSEKGERGEDAGDDTARRKGFGFSRGRNSERKRWSVCGGERRADLDLETIWED
ncbi:hypothetical protein AMS68_001650 [Peltaster fructicola]|uniref:Uncharacterized protein n=1 Tax=Peltaster fructicola TaxID=286661 RepID=A0A6H0XN34_9PEZI|nr:hypothetical protein AMS68_001650 [Peltaster fructicola]